MLQGSFIRMASCVEHKLLHLHGKLRQLCATSQNSLPFPTVFIKGLDWFSSSVDGTFIWMGFAECAAREAHLRCCKTGVRQLTVPRDGPRRRSCPQSLLSREMATSLTVWRI
jgi:hypothetical protein